jgi:hypothetical protein
MPFAYPSTPKYRAPIYDGAELHVYAHRILPGITPAERILVCVFLRRYPIWCAKARHFGRLRNGTNLLIEVAGTRPGHCPPDR